MTRHRLGLRIAALAGLLAISAVSTARAADEKPLIQDQGMGAEARRTFHHLSLGSEIVSLDLARSIDSVQTRRPFMESLGRFGLLDDPTDTDGLPIGLTSALARGAKSPIKMLGMNCASCHVAELAYKGRSIRIEGAPSKFDIVAFGSDLARSVEAAAAGAPAFSATQLRLFGQPEYLGLVNPSKPAAYKLFKGMAQEDFPKARAELAEAVGPLLGEKAEGWPSVPDLASSPLPDGSAGPEGLASLARKIRPALRKMVDARSGAGRPLGALDDDGRAAMSEQAAALIVETIWHLKQCASVYRRQDDLRKFGGVESGPGRVDDFRMAGNVIVDNLRLAKASTSPTAIPPTWATKSVRWLGWDGNADSTMQRNLATALAIGARFDRKTGAASIAPLNVFKLEEMSSDILAPKWPAELFGEIDGSKAQRGEALFAKNCVNCHVSASQVPYPDKLYDVKEIGTDPSRALNFQLDFDDRSRGATLPQSVGKLLQVVYMQNGIDAAKAKELTAGRAEAWRATGKYSGRSLAAIWASAPYLHNDSVPTLHDLLLPASRRPRTFRVGTRQYDPVNLGFVSGGDGDLDFLLDTSKEGNRNTGHEYGTDLSEDDRMALLEYLKGR